MILSAKVPETLAEDFQLLIFEDKFHIMAASFKLIFFLIACQLCISCRPGQTSRMGNRNSPSPFIQKFELKELLDTSGQPVDLDFSMSSRTIVDFWNNDCPPCISEMKQFPALISGKEKEISVVSICVNQYWVWKTLLDDTSTNFAFLKTYKLPNWKQYSLLTHDRVAHKNKFSMDRIEELENKYALSGFPSYFVVDSSGSIIATPLSAVSYIKENYGDSPTLLR